MIIRCRLGLHKWPKWDYEERIYSPNRLIRKCARCLKTKRKLTKEGQKEVDEWFNSW